MNVYPPEPMKNWVETRTRVKRFTLQSGLSPMQTGYNHMGAQFLTPKV